MAYSQIRGIKQEINNLLNIGEEEKDGSLIDIAKVLRRVVIQFEQKGIRYVLDKYWHKIKRGKYV